MPDRIEGVVFDLDDTLYEQMDYLSGAFRAASAILGDEAAKRVAAELVATTRERGSAHPGLFEEALTRCGLAADGDRLRAMERAFLAYRPAALHCYPGVQPMLATLAVRYPLALVSDGVVEMQRTKLRALGIAPYFRTIVLSDALGGTATRKPSPAPYLAALRGLRTASERTVCVGDNPSRDFAAARALGMPTIRVRTGEYRDVTAPAGDDADVVIPSAADLPALLR